MRSSQFDLKFGLKYGDVDVLGRLNDMGEEMKRSSSEHKLKFIICGNADGF